jgi:uncharacterized protein (DUF1330 family)
MAAYILIDRLAVTNPDALGAYEPVASTTVAGYAGRYVLPDAMHIEGLEGNWRPNHVVLIEFEDAARAKRWWNSAEYAGARATHREATISNIILVDDASL